MSRLFDRRAILAGAAALMATAAVPALAAGQRFSRIVVDVEPLRAKGLGDFAESVSAALGPALATEFAGAVDPRDRSAPLLVVRIDAVMLNGNLDGGDGRHGARFAVTDYMEGAGLVVANGKIIAQYPMLGAYNNVMGPGIMSANAFTLRLKALSAFYAGWMRRKVGA